LLRLLGPATSANLVAAPSENLPAEGSIGRRRWDPLSTVEYHVLGSLEVVHGGSTVVIGGPRHRRLLSILLISANQTVSSEALIDALWGEHPPNRAVDGVHARVSELRSALRRARPDRDSPLITRRGGYELRLGGDELDSRGFEGHIAAGRVAGTRGDLRRSGDAFRAALALWRGAPYRDLADLPVALGEIARLEGLHLSALEDRLGIDLALGEHEAAIAELMLLVAAHPLRERFWYQLMLAQYRAARQGEALATYQTARGLLIEGLGVDPGPELQRLHAAILKHDEQLDVEPSVLAPPHNVPSPVNSFVGRDWELTEVAVLLEQHRLVTIVGVGGVGKSRLAIEIARRIRRGFPGGCWVVELTRLSQAGLVAPTVARVLGIRASPARPLVEELIEHMSATRTLLVLDNCEHLIDETAEFTQRLLTSCDRLRVLATSRERLGITGEVLAPLAGLTVPAGDKIDSYTIGQSEAVQLFVQRGSAVRPGFHLEDGTAAAVSVICTRLDGLPLAIELAAARANALEVGQIASRLHDRFRLLDRGDRTAFPRHQTLRAVVDWSYSLLDAAARRLFDSVSVFVGGFDLDAVEAVCGEPGGATAGLIARLVDQSLLVAERTPLGIRYHQLETIRAYALERLDEAGRTAALRERHARQMLSFAQPAAIALRGPDQPAWLDRLETEHGNLRAALAWSIDTGATETALALAGSLYAFWDLHGHYREGQKWLSAALGLPGEVRPAMRARALMGSATLAVIQGDIDIAGSACMQALELSAEANDPAALAHAQQYLGLGAIFADDTDTALERLEESLSNARLAGDVWLEGWALTFLSAAMMARGENEEAIRIAAVCKTVSREAGDPECVAWALLLTGMAIWRSGKQVASAPALWEALREFERLGALWGLSVILFLSAHLAQVRGEDEAQVSLLGASERVRSTVGAALVPFIARWLDDTITQARARLGSDAFEHAWQAGERLSLDAAIALATTEFELATARTGHLPRQS